MQRGILAKAAGLWTRKHNRRIRQMIVGGLAAGVLLGTAYGMILPASTLEKDTVCGLSDHIHTDACYTPSPISSGNVSSGDVSSGDVSSGDVSAGNVPAQYPSERDFKYEDDNVSLAVHVQGSLDQEELWEEVTCQIVPVGEDSRIYGSLAEFMLSRDTTDQLYGLLAYSIRFYGQERELSTENWNITVQITPKQAILNVPTVMRAFNEESEGEGMNPPVNTKEGQTTTAEAGTVLSVLEESDGTITQLGDALVPTGEAAMPFTVTLRGKVLAVAAAQTANPSFTVQYYAYIDTVKTSAETGATALTVIDTNGGVLPVNGREDDKVIEPAIRSIYLEASAAAGKKRLATEDVLTQIYASANYQYYTAPNQSYFNRVYENGNYKLKQIWILKPGKQADSSNPDDWDVYQDPEALHFTNRSQSVSEDTILITDNLVIRLVYDSTTAAYNNGATFYDYDITNGKLYTAADVSAATSKTQAALEQEGSTIYAYTNQQGINSSGNYKNSSGKVKFAFGNVNTGMGLYREEWNGNFLNRYNAELNAAETSVIMATRRGYEGCTFGIVTGLSREGGLQYAEGIVAPNLFQEGSATGKTTYEGSKDNQYSLDFIREGDTYTLTAVKGTNTANLELFGNPGNYTRIWTNDFWPMDTAQTQGHDPRFGSGTMKEQRNYFNGTKQGAFPVSDDGMDHNSYFGMHYAVKFELTKDYVGPLEYYFFGDDDMWVFLSPADKDGNLTGEGTLVCDIGGVHSSVGEYVNLWDYIEKGSAGSYVLNFFYTERGSSGSTCFMRFTLPSVSSVTPEHNTDSLVVEKKVEGTITETEFDFEIQLWDEDGNHLKDDYRYTRYDSNGNEIESDLILYDGGSFLLRHGEYVIIKYLPIGAQYEITEKAVAGFYTDVSVNNGSLLSGSIATGSIHKDIEDKVLYVNSTSYALPDTGGSGILWYTMTGICLCVTAWILYRKNEKGRC